MKIKFVKPDMINVYGANERDFPDHFAEKMCKMGVARLVPSENMVNPSLDIAVPKALDFDAKKESLSLEHALYTYLVWIECGDVNQDLIDRGSDFGFKTSVAGLVPDDIDEIIMSDFVIMSSNNEFIPAGMIYLLKQLFYQKLVPYVMKVDSWMTGDAMWSKQLITRAKLNIFDSDALKGRYEEMLGDLISPYVVGIDNDQFWREIARVA